MPIHRFVNPTTVAKPPGYTHVVEATTPGRILYIAGQLGLDVDNKIVGAPGDFRAQAEQTFANLKNALAAVGATFAHVVKLNNYLVDMNDIAKFREVRDRHIDTAAPPASTTIAISTLARPGALLEIEAVAVVPQKAAGGAARSKGGTRGRAKRAGRSKAPAKSKSASRKRK
jgi:enamine deaminase RidA (YjgF/YER057c/UK114 family)